MRILPEHHSTITPMLCVSDAAAALTFYADVFGATEIRERAVDGEGKIAHSELMIGDSVLWIVDEYPEYDIFSPDHIGGSPVQLIVYVADVDDVFARAEAAGATIAYPVSEKPYEERSGRFDDPFGYRWSVRTLTGSRARE